MRLRAVMMFAVVVAGLSGRAEARPPTVTNSPGYDRALQESRRARQEQAPVIVEHPAPPKAPAKRTRQVPR